MQPDIFSCCKDATQKAPWIFVYENLDVYSICDVHFTSEAHRLFVQYAIEMKTPSKLLLPKQIFGDNSLEEMS